MGPRRILGCVALGEHTSPWRRHRGDATRWFDNRVFLHDVPWEEYEAILARRGDDPGLRLTYLLGELELMSPSVDHETVKTTLGRLVEAFADELGLDLNGAGSWTIKRREDGRGAEPDECYVLGPTRGRDRPDLAIEVVWTSGGIDKLEVYRGLRVPEVWRWDDGNIQVFLLRSEHYELVARSALLPGLDLVLVARLATSESQSAAVRELRDAVRAAK
jgi:Uma2 family endonuclease